MRTEELAALGLTKEQISKVHAMNGKSIAEHEKKLAELKAECESLKAEAEKAEAALLSLEGVDAEQVIAEIQSYKDTIAIAKNNFDKQMTMRDQKAWVDKKLNEYGINSSFARQQLTADIMAEDSGLVWQDGEYYGFDDYMRTAKEKDGSLYQEKDTSAVVETPRFTGPVDGHLKIYGESRKMPKIF
ncbi:MAG: phage scaffolding protein [Clostridia bacterium]|nr:phage scaffolding protein [Clostridia bacterium]